MYFSHWSIYEHFKSFRALQYQNLFVFTIHPATPPPLAFVTGIELTDDTLVKNHYADDATISYVTVQENTITSKILKSQIEF